ncbi:peroxiredoxin [symbiont of Argiope bruennichi]|uniref:peroxiredoxin n=1 Tax=symbiont of Argiope bruennichi TaxID=2810479 RepID=UPI003DA27CB1
MESKDINIEAAKKISLEGNDNKHYRLNDFKGKKIVLYFYPKDDTPGCTIQSKDYSNLYDQFLENNAIVIGCSKGDANEKEKFKNKYSLKQLLLADTNLELCKAMNVLKEKKFFGKNIVSISRSSFIFNENGDLCCSQYNVKHSEDASNNLEIIKNM